MINYLTKEEQQATLSALTETIQNALKANRHVYAIFEPTQDELIAEKFLMTGVKYTELLTPFIPEMEDVSPRLVELGQDEVFDTWVSEEALFNLWCGIFISHDDLLTLTPHLSYLSYVHTGDSEPTIFRFYNTLVLPAWLQGLHDEQMIEVALGIFSDIFYIKDFPYQLIHHCVSDKEMQTHTIDLRQSPCTFTVQERNNTTTYLADNWQLSAVQQQPLLQVKPHHFLLQLREQLMQQEAIAGSYSLAKLHQLLVEIIDTLSNNGIDDTHLMATLIELYFEYTQAWHVKVDEISLILREDSMATKDKLEIIADWLYETNERINEKEPSKKA